MQVVKAIYDGHNIKPIETVAFRRKTEVLVIFPDDTNHGEKVTAAEARRLLRGSGKGEKLTERLLKYRADDAEKERQQRR